MDIHGCVPPYTAFCGAVELSAGLLLLFERTRVPGSLLAMANVLVLNLCYDVDVKLYSFHLFLMSVVLLLPNLHGLANYLLRGRAATPVVLRLPQGQRRWPRNTGRALLATVVGLTLYNGLKYAVEGARHPWSTANRPPVAGAWNVTSFVVNGTELAANDPRHWRQLVIDFPTFWVVHYSNANARAGNFTARPQGANRVHLQGGSTGSSVEFTWERPTPHSLTLTGTVDGSPAVLRLQQADDRQYELTTRGFHWVSEYSYNW